MELTVEKLCEVRDLLERETESIQNFYIPIHPRTMYLFRVMNARYLYKQKSRRLRIMKHPVRFISSLVRKFFHDFYTFCLILNRGWVASDWWNRK